MSELYYKYSTQGLGISNLYLFSILRLFYAYFEFSARLLLLDKQSTAIVWRYLSKIDIGTQLPGIYLLS